MKPLARPTSWAAVIIVLGATGAAGCSTSTETAPTARASVTINDVSLAPQAPRCSRLESYLTVDIGQLPGEVTGVLDITGDQPIAQWVKIRDAGGFSGDFWRGGVGSADAFRTAEGYAVTGSAYGVYASRPDELGVTATFRIEATC